MPKKRREPKLVTRVLVVDGEPHLIIERRCEGLITRRLRGWERAHALRLIESWQADVESHVLGRATAIVSVSASLPRRARRPRGR